MNSIMVVDGIALFVIGAYTFFGFRYGLTGILINLAGMVGGYIASLMWARPVADWLGAHTSLSPILSVMCASMIVFFGVTRFCYLVHLVVRRVVEGDKTGPSPFIAFDHWAGAGYGALKGTVLAAVMLWALPVVVGYGQMGERLGLPRSQLVGFVQASVSAGARFLFGFVFDDLNARGVFAHALSDPRATLSSATAFATSPKVTQLTEDASIRQLTHDKGPMAVLVSKQFENLLRDREVQAYLRGIGFTPNEGFPVTAEDIGRCYQELNNKLAKLMPSPNTSLPSFLSRADVKEELREGDILHLLQNAELPGALGLTSASAPQVEQAHGE